MSQVYQDDTATHPQRRRRANALRFLAFDAVEAGYADYWHKYLGGNGQIVGMTTFGDSAPAPALYAHFGITVERVVEACLP